MPNYKYQIRGTDGQTSAGVIAANDLMAAAAQLRGLFPECLQQPGQAVVGMHVGAVPKLLTARQAHLERGPRSVGCAGATNDPDQRHGGDRCGRGRFAAEEVAEAGE